MRKDRMNVFVLGTCRAHRIFIKEKDGQICDNTNGRINPVFSHCGYLHNAYELNQFLKFVSKEETIDFSKEENLFLFRKEPIRTTPKNEFNQDLEIAIKNRTKFKLRNIIVDCSAVVIEICSSQYHKHITSGTFLHTNPNFINNYTYQEIYPDGYYAKSDNAADVSSGKMTDKEIENCFIELSETLKGKDIYIIGHLVDPKNRNAIRHNLNLCLKELCQKFNFTYIDTENYVDKHGFLCLPNGSVDIHHLSHEGECELGKDLIDSILEREKLLEKMELSFTNISKLLTEGKITENFILDILFQKDIINKIKKDSIKEGFWSFSKVMTVLESFAMKYCMASLKKISDKSSIYNMAYIMPSLFIEVSNGTPEFYLNLSDAEFNSILSRGQHFENILNIINSTGTWSLQPRKVLNFLFRLTSSKMLNRIDEQKVLESALQYIRNIESHNYSAEPLDELIQLIDNRNNSLKRLPSKASPVKTPASNRIALFICGQLRGYKSAIQSIAASFKTPSLVDVYVSTWEDIGWGMLSIERLPRFFTTEAYEYMTSKYSYEDARQILHSLIRTSEGHDVTQAHKIFTESFSSFNSMKFNAFDDSKYPFNRMNNSEKMYFHNSYWIETLGERHFSSYERLIKVRPDLKLANNDVFFDSIEIDDHTIYVENHGGWIFRDWGFGIGDQIIIGKTESALKVLNCHGESKLYTKALRSLNKTQYGYSGHRNCGLAAWANGYDCDVSLVRPTEICNITKFTIDQIRLIEEIGK